MKKKGPFWLSLCIRQKMPIEFLGEVISPPLDSLATGCVGVILAFDTEENARGFSKGKVPVQKITVEDQ